MTIRLRDIYGVSADDLLPAGGTTGQVLAKQSATDGDYDWGDVDSGPIKEFDATEAYAVNDVVFHDGNLYRAKEAIAAGVFDENEWIKITSDVEALPPNPTGIKTKGGITGLEGHYVDRTNVRVGAGKCLDETGTISLFLGADKTVPIGTLNAASIYYIFIAKHADNSIDIHFDEDVDGVNLPATVTHKRVLSFIRTTPASEITEFEQKHNIYRYCEPSTIYTNWGDNPGIRVVSGVKVDLPSQLYDVSLTGYIPVGLYKSITIAIRGANSIQGTGVIQLSKSDGVTKSFSNVCIGKGTSMQYSIWATDVYSHQVWVSTTNSTFYNEIYLNKMELNL